MIPAASFGLSAAVIPGPLLVYVVNATLTHGWRKSLLVVLAPLITDAPIIILMTFVLSHFPSALLQAIQVAGGSVLLFIAYSAGRRSRLDVELQDLSNADVRSEQSWRQVLLFGLMMNILSPGPWLFWATINGPLLIKALEQSPWHALAFLLAFYGVFLSGLCGWILLFQKARRIPDIWLHRLILATVALLLWFGIGLITAALNLGELQLPLAAALVAAALVHHVLSASRY